MENKLEENIKGKKKEFMHRKEPKRTYRSPGDVNTGTCPSATTTSIAGGTLGHLDRDCES